MSTGCCMETNLTINFIFKKQRIIARNEWWSEVMGVGERGKWVMGIEKSPVGMSTGCCMETNLTIDYI